MYLSILNIISYKETTTYWNLTLVPLKIVSDLTKIVIGAIQLTF